MSWTNEVRVAVVVAAVAMPACQEENVTSVVVTDVIVEPAQASVVAGEGLAFTAMIVDEQNVLLEGASVSWTSEDPAVVRVTLDGRAEAVSAGSTRIVATYQGVTGSASVTVQPPRCQPHGAPGKGKGGDDEKGGKGKKGKGDDDGGGDDDDDDGDDDDDDDDDDGKDDKKDDKKGDKDKKDDKKGGEKDDGKDDGKDDDGDDEPPGQDCVPAPGGHTDTTPSGTGSP